MIIVLKANEVTQENLDAALETFGKKRTGNKKPLAKHFGKLKRGIDGVQYQREVRDEWN